SGDATPPGEQATACTQKRSKRESGSFRDIVAPGLFGGARWVAGRRASGPAVIIIGRRGAGVHRIAGSGGGDRGRDEQAPATRSRPGRSRRGKITGKRGRPVPTWPEVGRSLVFVEPPQLGAVLGSTVELTGRLGRLRDRVFFRGRQELLVLQEVEEGD